MKTTTQNERMQNIVKKAELQRLWEVYMVDIVKMWKCTSMGQITMDMSVPYKPAHQIFDEFMEWKNRESKNIPKK